MVKLTLGLLADNAHVDGSGKLYILGEFRYINALKVPAQHGRLSVVARLEGPTAALQGGAKVQVELADQDGKAIIPRSPELDVKFLQPGPASRGKSEALLLMQLDGMPLPTYGGYAFNFWVNGQYVGDIPFHVVQPPQGGGPADGQG